MKKRFTILTAALMLLAMFASPMGMWGQTTADVTLSSGTFNNNVITWTCADGNITIQQLKGSGSTNPNGSYMGRVYKQNILSFVGTNGYTITNIDIKCDGIYYGTTKYAGTEISNNDVSNNTTALNPTWSTTNGGTHTIATVSSDGLSEIYIQNGHSSDANTQLRITKLTITYKVTGSVTATTVTINTSGLTNTDVYTSTTAGTLTASVTETESGDAISGATVAWSSSNTDVATIDNNGAVTLVAVGTSTITASYAGGNGYGSSSATYELTVTSSEPYVQPTEIEITPNYTFWGFSGQFSGTTNQNLSGSKDNVSLNWNGETGNTYANSSAMRFYAKNTLTFTAPTGYEIESIVITFTTAQEDLSFSPGSYSLSGTTGTWTGSSETVTMTRPSSGTGYAQITKFTITIGIPSSAVATTTTINVPANFNTDIYQGTTAGTLTATVKDNENNTISGATVTWESSNTDVATVDNSGAVTLVAVGTTNITATYAGDQTYAGSVGTYSLTVVDNTPSTGTDVTFTAGTETGSSSMTKSNVTISCTNANFTYNPYRIYASTVTTISVPAGYTITKVVINGANDYDMSKFTANDGAYSVNSNNVGTWTGDASSVEFTNTHTAQLRVTSFVVTIESTGSTPTISASPSTLNTFSYLTNQGPSAAQSVSVSGANLTDDVTVSVGNNSAFEISTTEEGTYTNNLTLTQTSGAVAATNVYVRMKAQQTGTPSGTLSISSTDATTINITLSGSVVTPMTVAEAIAAIDAASGNTVSGAYVSGIISQIDSYSTSYHSITYWISDNGRTTTQLEVYSGKGLNGANFNSIDDLTVGDQVVVYGDLKIHESVYEFNYNSQIISLTPSTSPSITVANGSAAAADVSCTMALTYQNMTPSSAEVFSVILCDENGDAASYAWITNAEVTGQNGDYVVSCTITANSGAARTAYLKVVSGQATSNIATLTQAAYVAPSTAKYVRITSLDKLTKGCKVIIAARYDENDATAYKAMPAPTSSGKPTGVDFTSTTSGTDEILPSTITDFEDTYSWIVNITDDGYTFTNANNQLISYGSSGTDFTLNGSKCYWVIERKTAEETALVAEYTGFVITNKTTTTRGFAYNNTGVFGAYATSNEAAKAYNFFLDLFVCTDAVSFNISTYTSQTNGWHLIASPVATAPSQATNMLSNTYDLYYFDQSQTKQWVNYKTGENNVNPGFSLEPGKGYLYANSGDGVNDQVTIGLIGTLYCGNGTFTLAYDDDVQNSAKGWNLMGNPFANETYIGLDYYRMNSTNDDLTLAESTEHVNMFEGIFVHATAANQTVTFSTTAPSKSRNNDALVINLNKDDKVIDRAIARFGESEKLSKFQLFEGSTKIYIPQNDTDYAIAAMDDNTQAFSLNFHAKTTGKYTLSLGETNNLSYIHLFDRMTGEDIDMLLEDSYSFIGSPADSEERFIVRLSYNAGISTDDTFAFQNGNDIIVNGNGELQIFDVMGRMVKNTVINGVETIAMPQGVYIFRLNENIQKIVVR